MSRIFHLVALIALALLALALAGCGPSLPVAALPPPAFALTPAASPSATVPVTPLPIPGPGSPAAPAPDLLQLAAQAYGSRLISAIEIPALDISSPVVAVGWTVKQTAAGGSETEWDSPDSLAGWVVISALPGDGSNIILYGHNNLYTSIFKDLGKLKVGDQISLRTGERSWLYRVAQVSFLRTTFADKDTLQSYDKYLQPTSKEQLTLISCWPPISNTHRVVVLAEPVH